jgi:tetratricopeptide (TPR) repeat protein
LKPRWLASLLWVSLLPQACPASEWRLARSEHFEVYSQSGDENARIALASFEQLRGFFLEQDVIPAHQLPAMRVIVFGSSQEYEPYRLRSTADAHYVGGEGRDYILMAASGPSDFAVAAHEYAHFVMRVAGYHLPAWLGEGLAEVFSTVRVSERGCEFGGDLPARSQALRRRAWMPIPELLALTADSPERQNRDGGAVFYSQSWALADLLVFSPAYAPRFPQLIAALNAGRPSVEALTTVYGTSPDIIASDLRAWVYQDNRVVRRLPGILPANPSGEISGVPPRAAQSVLAEALLAGGDLDRSEALYRDLAQGSPEAADVWAGLGTIALRRGNNNAARDQWKRAIELGELDPILCYRFAVLASDAGLPADEIRPALERAVAARPGFDDARYMLALLEKNTGHFDAAVAHLRAIKNVGPARAYGYWCALAYSLTELDRREEAVAAARQAAEHATTPGERANATTLDYMARTDLAVRFDRDANGRAQLVTTRIPHATTNWNPFIEAGDDLRRVQGTLREVDCDGEHTRVRVATTDGPLTLAIVDASRVEMRNAPAEFVCGPQADAPPVTVEYAASQKGSGADGLLRGMEFTPGR